MKITLEENDLCLPLPQDDEILIIRRNNEDGSFAVGLGERGYDTWRGVRRCKDYVRLVEYFREWVVKPTRMIHLLNQEAKKRGWA